MPDITAIFKFAGELLGIVGTWFGRKNSPEMIKQKQQQDAAKKEDAVEKEINKKDENSVRNDLAD